MDDKRLPAQGLARRSVNGPRCGLAAVVFLTSLLLALPDASAAGLLAFTKGTETKETTGIYTADAETGANQKKVAESKGSLNALSPNGSQIAYSEGTGNTFLINSDGTNNRLFAGARSYPAWSPDERYIAFGVAGGELEIINVATGGKRKIPAPGPEAIVGAPCWSRDGRYIAFGYSEKIVPEGFGPTERSRGIWVRNADGTGTAKQVAAPIEVEKENNEVPRYCAFGPNDVIAYVLRETHVEPNPFNNWVTENIWRVNVDGSGARRVTSATQAGEEDQWAAWNKAGTEIFFQHLAPTQTKPSIYSVALATGAEHAVLEGGNGIGYEQPSAETAIATPEPEPEELLGAENPATHLRPGCQADPVNCATGNLVEAQTDLAVGGRGVSLSLTRTYNAFAAAKSAKGLYGYGWSASFEDHLTIEPTAERVVVHQANGSTAVFKGSVSSPGALLAPAWVFSKLVLNSDGTYTYTLPTHESFQFSSTGLLLSESDRNGNTTTLNRSEAGRLESVTDAAGRKLTFGYNAEGLIETATDPMGHAVKYGYEAGQLTSVTLPGQTTPRWQFKYDGSHRLVTMTDGRNGNTTSEYDSANRVISQADPAGRTISFAYEPQHTTITNKATGAVTKETFTTADELESVTHGYGTTSATTASYTYDSLGDRTSATDGNGHATQYGYDVNGDLTSQRDPNGHETNWAYDENHDMLSTVAPNGEKTTFTLNTAGLPETISRPGPAETTQATKYSYGPHGEIASMTDPLGHIWKYEYDSQGDRTVEIDPEGDKTTREYDADSREIASVSPRGNVTGAEPAKYTTKTERDPQERILAITGPLGHTTKYTYDGNGNLETVIDANGDMTSYTYDADNERTKVMEPGGTIKETGYDGAGQVTSETDGNKHTTKYVRNILEQVTELVDPKGRKTLNEYDKAGNLTKITDPAKRVTTRIFDPANQLKEITYSDGKTHLVQYTYNNDGLRTKMVDGTGEATYTYDQLDRLTEAKDGHANVTKYEYNLADQQTKITYPNGKAVTRSYDQAGRLTTVTDWLEQATTVNYDADSNPTSITYPTATGNQDNYSYDEADQLTEAKMMKGSETLASLAYSHDSDGQIKETTSKGVPGEEKLPNSYDSNGRLTKAAAIPYEYDAANNPTKIGTTTYTYDIANELEASSAGPKYSYDELGERTKLTPTTGASTLYSYDQAGNLITVEQPKEGKSAGFKDTFAYNGDSLRLAQTIGGTTSNLAWDVSKPTPLMLNDAKNNYIYGLGDLPVEQINSEGKAYFLHQDIQGSTRLITSTTGKTEATFTYDAYGNTTGSTGTITTPLGYNAQYTNSDTGLIYLRARTYDPKTAQFLTVDPLTGITRAPYTYGQDNPISNADRSGLVAEGDWVGPYTSQEATEQEEIIGWHYAGGCLSVSTATHVREDEETFEREQAQHHNELTALEAANRRAAAAEEWKARRLAEIKQLEARNRAEDAAEQLDESVGDKIDAKIDLGCMLAAPTAAIGSLKGNPVGQMAGAFCAGFSFGNLIVRPALGL